MAEGGKSGTIQRLGQEGSGIGGSRWQWRDAARRHDKARARRHTFQPRLRRASVGAVLDRRAAVTVLAYQVDQDQMLLLVTLHLLRHLRMLLQ